MSKKRSSRDQDGLYKRNDSPYWWVSYINAGGKRTRRSTGTADRKEAGALLAKWKLEAHRERQWDEAPSKSFDELMLVYLDGPSRKKRSSERDRYSAKRLYPFFTGRELHTLTASDVTAYVQSRERDGVGPATINKEIGLFSAALNWARRELEWDVQNPFQSRRLREPEGRIRWITRAEAAALMQAAEAEAKAGHLVDFIRLGLHTGMRRGEMLGLEWRRVDLQEGLLYLESEHQKSGRIGSVPMNREARAAIISRATFRAEHCPASPWVFSDKNGNRIKSMKRSFATACKRAGIENFHPHDLRHTCAAWLVQSGVPIREVAELLRHSDIKVTMRYAHLAPENVRAAVTALEGVESRLSHVEENRELAERGK
jgi:integrase